MRKKHEQEKRHAISLLSISFTMDYITETTPFDKKKCELEEKTQEAHCFDRIEIEPFQAIITGLFLALLRTWHCGMMETPTTASVAGSHHRP